MTSRQFLYSQSQAFPDFQGGLPFLPITLSNMAQSVSVSALADSGTSVNVLPYDIGIQLGLIWETQNYLLPSLTGRLRDSPAFGVLLEGQVNPFEPVSLAFAWTQSNEVPVILGQINFFAEFDVYFFGSQKRFEIKAKKENQSQ